VALSVHSESGRVLWKMRTCIVAVVAVAVALGPWLKGAGGPVAGGYAGGISGSELGYQPSSVSLVAN
jgi:hypothetical protein